MSDDWEDWENPDFVIPVLSLQNEEQLKQLKERKLVEESDNDLTKSLFSNKEENLAYEYLKNIEQKNMKPISITQKKELTQNPYNKNKQNKQNEQKQKEYSKKIKEEKFKKMKEKEIFGEAEEDKKYSKYENMFY